jgi:hypothetical protein
VFSLRKRSDVWTLHYETSLFARILWICTGLAGIGVGAFQVYREDTAFARGGTVAVVLVCLGVLTYWIVDDAESTVHFDLKRRRVEVESKRLWFGRPRNYAFADIAALTTVRRSGESSDTYEAILELTSGKRIKLGREVEGDNEQIRKFVDEIRAVTGIAGR